MTENPKVKGVLVSRGRNIAVVAAYVKVDMKEAGKLGAF
jgi:hypothetical protein